MRLSDSELEGLISGGESWRVAFKESVDKQVRQSIAKTICALANDLPNERNPGVVLVGIRDDGTNAGLTIDDQLLRSLTDIRNEGHILPPPNMLVEKRALSDGKVAVIWVAPSSSPPVRYRGVTYVRSGPQIDIATIEQEGMIGERRRLHNRPFDALRFSGAARTDLNIKYFETDYLPQAISAEVLAANERSVDEQLASTKMISSATDACPTVLGLLVLGNQPKRFIPAHYVEFLRFDGDMADNRLIDSHQIDGTVAEIVRQTEILFDLNITTSVDFIGLPREKRNSSYPSVALQQLFRNAIMHRSYQHNNAPVRIMWSDDRIEIINPGGLFGEVTKENFGTRGVTSYRNPNLAEAMFNLGFVQRFGMGVPLARQLLQSAGHPEPEYRFDPTYTIVTVRARTRGKSG